jgi:hypothetical protein
MSKSVCMICAASVTCALLFARPPDKPAKTANVGVRSTYSDAIRIDSPDREKRGRLFNGAANAKVRNGLVQMSNEALSETSGPLDLWRAPLDGETFPTKTVMRSS